MNEETAKPLCDARSDSFRVRCMLPEGHVTSMDDWHWASAETGSHVKTNAFKQTVTGTEQIHWRPNAYELPKDQAIKELSKLIGKEEEQS